MKRISDIIFSTLGLLVFLPLLIFICIIIPLDSRGAIFYSQIRVGKNNTNFKIYKFRSMKIEVEKSDLFTFNHGHNSYVTNVGKFIRKYKIDELPQLLNVLIGDMSLVGPRPEIRKYVDLYSPEQKVVLTVKPGITDYASILYCNENEMLRKSNNPEELYIQKIMPVKLSMSLKYISEQSLLTDLKIILLTIRHIINE